MAPTQKLLNRYEEFSDGIAELDASNEGLTDSDLIGIGELTKLTGLALGENNLNSIPPELSKLTNLTKLDLYQNNLNSIPPELSNLTNLIYLYLGKNNLNSIPPELSKLTNLTCLSLSQNKLSYLPLEFKNLKNLQDLWLFDNPNMIFPPKEILEKANANFNKTAEAWEKLGRPKANPEIIKKYLETKEAVNLFTALFPPSSFLQDICNMF